MSSATYIFGILLVFLASPRLQGGQAEELIVTSILNKPYLMEDVNKTSGHITYRGFIVDLLDSLAKFANFKYKIHTVQDGSYGRKREDGNWTGMIGEIVSKTADIAAGPLTVTSQRQAVVQFSMPFQSNGPAILMRKQPDATPDFGDRLMRLFAPMSSSVWLLSLIGIMATGTVLYIICYFSPVEWRKMAMNSLANDRERESFTCMNSFWFIASSLTWQGFERTPRSVGARIVVFTWWFFCALFLITYTASLTNYIRIVSQWDEFWNKLPDVSDLKELSAQNTIDYGMIEGGSTQMFFQNSKVPAFKHIYDDVNRRKSFHPSIEQGLSEVRRSYDRPYAFIVESMMGKYIANQKPCDLVLVDDMIASQRFYSFAFRPGLKLATAINQGILEMREDGRLHELKVHWWKDKCSNFDNELSRPVRESFYAVTLGGFSGTLIMLVIGLLLGSLVAAFECLIFRNQNKIA